jgi:uncharacterized protein YxjI
VERGKEIPALIKLYIKQNAFSWRDKFAVKDEDERDRWFAKGEIASLARTMHVYDMEGAEIALVQQKILALLPTYSIVVDGKEYVFARKYSLLHPKYVVSGLDWTVSGNFLAHDYTITDERGEVMRLAKAWLAWGDAYELAIADERNELLGLCVALAIDCITTNNATIVASSSNG